MARDGGGAVVATFKTEPAAERALEALQSRGVTVADISVGTRGTRRGSRVGLDLGSNVFAAAGLGALFGALVLGATAWFLALGSMAQPGAGPTSGIGSIAATVTGAVLGVLIGGLVGGLAGLAIPTSPDAMPGDEGHIVVEVRTPTALEVEHLEEILAANGGEDVRSVAAPSFQSAQSATLQTAPAEPPFAPLPAAAFEDFSGLQAIARQDEEPNMQNRWMSGDAPSEGTPGRDEDAATQEEVRLDIEASTGEAGWYQSLPDPPTSSGGPSGPATYSGLTEDEETWADLANLERQEESSMNENPEGTNPNTATGTQGAVNPDTGTFGTAGTPVTAGHGASGSTIGTGTSGGEQATQSGDFRGSTPDAASYEMGGRASTDSQESLEGDERDATVEDKYARRDEGAAPIQQDPGTVDVYEAGPSYGPGTRQEVDRTDLYSNSDVDTAPTFAVTPTDESHSSSGTDIPGTADPRGLGDNTDDPR